MIEYAFVLCPGGVIGAQHLPEPVRKGMYEPTPVMRARRTSEDLRGSLLEALEMAGGNQSQAAKLLGVSRVTVWKRMKKFGISPADFT